MPSNLEMMCTNIACTESCEFIAVVFDTRNNILAV